MGGWYEQTIGRLLAKPRGFAGGDRAQSQVIGAVLIFAFVIAALGAAQVVLVPQNNEDVEFSHNQQVQQDMQELRSALQRSAAVGASQSESVDLGADYPTRLLLLNPAAGSGTIRTAGGTNLTIENATATDEEIRDFWTGDPADTVSVPSKRLIYAPSYNYYSNSPDTVYENSVLYNKFEGSQDIAKSDQDLVDGRRIYLIALEGNKSVSKTESATVDVKSVSTATESITVERDAPGEPVNITIPTELSEEVWVQELLAEEIDDTDDGPGAEEDDMCGTLSGVDDGNDKFIVACDYETNPSAPNELTLFLQEENSNNNPVTYNLKMAKAGVGSGVTTPGPQYITDLKGDGADVALNGRQEVAFQVRDKYNNPAEDAEVDVEITDGPGRLFNQGDDITGQPDDNIPVGPDGKVELTYVAPGTTSSSPVDVNVSAKFGTGSSFGSGGAKDANVSMEVINASRIDRTAPLFNPSEGIVVEGAEFRRADCVGGPGNDGNCEVEVRFENLGSSTSTIEKIRYTFFSADSQGLAASGPSATLEIQDFQNSGTDLVIKDDFRDINDVSFSSGQEKSMTVHMFEDTSKTNADSIGPGDFLVISVIEDGERRTYFFAPADGN